MKVLPYDARVLSRFAQSRIACDSVCFCSVDAVVCCARGLAGCLAALSALGSGFLCLQGCVASCRGPLQDAGNWCVFNWQLIASLVSVAQHVLDSHVLTIAAKTARVCQGVHSCCCHWRRWQRAARTTHVRRRLLRATCTLCSSTSHPSPPVSRPARLVRTWSERSQALAAQRTVWRRVCLFDA